MDLMKNLPRVLQKLLYFRVVLPHNNFSDDNATVVFQVRQGVCRSVSRPRNRSSNGIRGKDDL